MSDEAIKYLGEVRARCEAYAWMHESNVAANAPADVDRLERFARAALPVVEAIAKAWTGDDMGARRALAILREGGKR